MEIIPGKLQLLAVPANSGVGLAPVVGPGPALSVSRAVSAEPAVGTALVVGRRPRSRWRLRQVSCRRGPAEAVGLAPVVNFVEYFRKPRCWPRCSFRSHPYFRSEVENI